MSVPTAKIKKSSLAPISVVFFGGNFLGARITEQLLERDSRVIVVDEFTPEKEIYFLTLRDNPKLLLINSDLSEGIPAQINTVDYIYLNTHFDYYSPDQEDRIQKLEKISKYIVEFAKRSLAKVELISNIEVKNKNLKFSINNQIVIREILFNTENSSKLNLREISLPIIYGPKMSLENSKGLARILDSYINQTEVFLNDENKFKDFYLYIDDAITGIFKSMFSEASSNHRITLCDKESHSEMEIGSILKNIASKHVDFNYIEDKYRLEWVLPEEKNLHLIGFAPKTKLKEGINKTLNYFGYEPNDYTYRPLNIDKYQSRDENQQNVEKLEVVKTNFNKTIQDRLLKYRKVHSFEDYKNKLQAQSSLTKKINPFKISLTDLFYLLLTGVISLIMIFLILPITTIYINFYWAQNNISQIKKELASGNIVKVITLSDETSKNISTSISSFKKFKGVFTLIAGKEKYQEYENIILSLGSFSEGLTPFSKGISPYLDLHKNLEEQREIEPETFKNSQRDLSASLEYFNIASEFLNEKEINIDRKEVQEYKENLPKIIKLNKLLLSISKDYIDFFGYNKPHKVLVLFQNPAEIRPTGGFIGSYGILEISKGKIISIKIDDIYNPDGQIDIKKIDIAPPLAIKNYLNESRLYTRNANFSPDFPTSAKSINNLFNLAIGESFDTVVSIDYFFIKEFLKSQGSVFLNSYNEEITAENFVERAQFHSEFGYKPGISEKKSFLTTLGSKILEKFMNLEISGISESSNSAYSLLENGNIQVHTEFPRIATVLKNLEWDGSLIPTNGDYLKVVNANLGGNKVNYLIKNFYRYEVVSKTRDGVLRSRLSLNYQNLANDNSWPYGTYKNYARILVPKGSRLTGATVQEQNQEKNVFPDIKQGIEGMYQTFEIGIQIEPKESQTIVIEYDLPSNLDIIKNQKTDYSLIWQNQPGEDTRVEFSFSPPYGFDIGEVVSNKNTSFSKEKVDFNENQEGDFKVEVILK